MALTTVIVVPTHDNATCLSCWSSIKWLNVRQTGAVHFAEGRRWYFTRIFQHTLIKSLAPCVVCANEPSVRECVLERPLKKCKAWWCHFMETFSVLLTLCGGIHRPPLDSPNKCQWRGVLMIIWCAPVQTVDIPLVWDAMTLIVTSL